MTMRIRAPASPRRSPTRSAWRRRRRHRHDRHRSSDTHAAGRRAVGPARATVRSARGTARHLSGQPREPRGVPWSIDSGGAHMGVLDRGSGARRSAVRGAHRRRADVALRLPAQHAARVRDRERARDGVRGSSARAAPRDVRAAAALHVREPSRQAASETRRCWRASCAARKSGAPRASASAQRRWPASVATATASRTIRATRVDPRPHPAERPGSMPLVATQFLISSSVVLLLHCAAPDRWRLAGQPGWVGRRAIPGGGGRRPSGGVRRPTAAAVRWWRRLRRRRGFGGASTAGASAAAVRRRRRLAGRTSAGGIRPRANPGPRVGGPAYAGRCRPPVPCGRSRSSASTCRAATSRRRSPTSRSASTPVRPMSCCSARPEPASRRRRPG